MSGLETAIRTALERSDRANPEMRARIYQSARHALEAGLRKQNITDPQVINEQRHRLETLIHGVEQEERTLLEQAAAASAALVDPVRTPSATGPASTVGEDAPSIDGAAEPIRRGGDGLSDLRAERGAGLGEAPEASADATAREPTAGALNVPPEAAVRHRKRRSGLYSRIFIFCVLLASAGMGAWWLYSADVLKSAADRDTSVHTEPTAEDEDYTGEPNLGAPATQQGFSDEWIEVFKPEQVATIRPGAKSAVNMVATGDGQAVHIVSNSSEADGNVALTIPVEILREMAGQTSTIALTLRAAADTPVQIAIECDFERLGNCARHRFDVNPEKADILLRVSFERALAPSNPGRLLINGDIAGKGQGIDLYSVRVLAGR